MKLQTFALFLIAFAICVFAAPAAEPTQPCGCANSCTVSCAPGKSCNCPAWCDPAYSCLSTRSTNEGRDAAPSVLPLPNGVPCGCHNACTLYGCQGIPKKQCNCLDYCDPIFSCDSSVKARQEKPPTSSAIPCGCHNDCTLFGCGDDIPKDECFCTLQCDLKYACPTPTPTPTPGETYAREVDQKCGCTNDCKIACPKCICPQYCGKLAYSWDRCRESIN